MKRLRTFGQECVAIMTPLFAQSFAGDLLVKFDSAVRGQAIKVSML